MPAEDLNINPKAAPHHTFVVSDIHLTTAEPPHPKDPLWRKFKRREFFIDDAFGVFLKKIEEKVGDEKVELILAGDIFDFDGVTQMPDKSRFNISWLERKRGLNAEMRKSRFKMSLIIQDHPTFFEVLGQFIKRGHRVVFIIGNHDLELHWMGVREMVLSAMCLTLEDRARVKFTNWFYISGGDTLVEHGNQHDSHSNCQNPINPRIHGLRRGRIRLPFSSLANRYMLNGMGYFNPHSDRSYIMSAKQYFNFAIKHLIRREPLIMWTWFWGACATLVMTLKEGFTPEIKNPLKVEDQVEEIAQISNATPRMVRELKEMHAPPMFMDPISVLRELWLDRAFIVIGVIFFGYQLLGFMNFIVAISYLWTPAIVTIFLVPFFMFYYRSHASKVIVDVKYYEKAVKLSAKIARVRRVIFGHTHQFVHTNFDGVEYLNSGTWAPAFDDIACTIPAAPKTFVWIRPRTEAEQTAGPEGLERRSNMDRIANVFEWKSNEITLLC